jgi:hypothetical protein
LHLPQLPLRRDGSSLQDKRACINPSTRLLIQDVEESQGVDTSVDNGKQQGFSPGSCSVVTCERDTCDDQLLATRHEDENSSISHADWGFTVVGIVYEFYVFYELVNFFDDNIDDTNYWTLPRSTLIPP